MSDFFNFPMWAVEKTAKATPAPLPEPLTLAQLQEAAETQPEVQTIEPKRPGRPKGSKNKESK